MQCVSTETSGREMMSLIAARAWFLPSSVRESDKISLSVMVMASHDHNKLQMIKVKWLMCHMACRQVLA